MRLFKIALPNIEKLSHKDSKLSTKRYADLRIINHFVWMSWVSLIALIFANQWDSITTHLAIVGAFAFGRGALALKSVKDFINKE